MELNLLKVKSIPGIPYHPSYDGPFLQLRGTKFLLHFLEEEKEVDSLIPTFMDATFE